MLTFAIIIATLAFIWNVVPIIAVLNLHEVPRDHRRGAALCMASAAGRGLLVLLPDLLAPFVVPIALLGTTRDSEHLPAWASWWDNDVSINGDQKEGAPTYYAEGHDRRSFWARWVWLGLRNRASALSVRLGHTYAPGEYADAEHWGDPLVGRDHEGWTLNRRGPAYQLYWVRRIGKTLCLRSNSGFKVWAKEGDNRPTANVVNITISCLRWRGA